MDKNNDKNRENTAIVRFPVIDVRATGMRICALRKERGLSVRELTEYFGFNNVQTVYKWQSGICLPTVENLYALSRILEVPLEEILVERKPPEEPEHTLRETEEILELYLLYNNTAYYCPAAQLPDTAD